jgi:hypothetical protein
VHIPRSRLSDYIEMAPPPDAEREVHPQADQSSPPPTSDESSELPTSRAAALKADEVARRRREFAALLGEFRRTAVLLPITEDETPLTGDYGGIRWIYAFSDEAALARFAIARDEDSREWPYRRVLGARLLDAAVPAAGVAGLLWTWAARAMACCSRR